MTLDEAIKHAREKAEEQRKDNDTCVVKEGYGCKDCAYYYSKPCIECAEEHEQLAEWLEELKEYRDLEEQGLLLKLPCKIGTNKLYYIDDDKEIYRINGDEVSIKRFPSGQIIYDYDCYEFSYEDFGKTVFLTKEAAEKALERLEKDNELY